MDPSKTSVDRAGSVLRARGLAKNGIGDDEYRAALERVESYKAGFRAPTGAVAKGLSSFLSTLGVAQASVTSRVKRLPRIETKLARESCRLSQMQDIGGCRAPTLTPVEVGIVAARIRDKWKVKSESDYRQQPRDTGYRALHMVVERNGRLIEIQLRTVGQHRWAQGVENLGDIKGVALKDGDGPEFVREFLMMASERIAAEEYDSALNGDWQLRHDTLRDEVVQWITDEGGHGG